MVILVSIIIEKLEGIGVTEAISEMEVIEALEVLEARGLEVAWERVEIKEIDPALLVLDMDLQLKIMMGIQVSPTMMILLL